jgi:hypothetical protein
MSRVAGDIPVLDSCGERDRVCTMKALGRRCPAVAPRA